MKNMTLPGRCTTTEECKYRNKHRSEPYECLFNSNAHAQPGSAGKLERVRFGAETK